VAFAVVLLSGALLVGQQFFQWRQVERGFRPERLFTAEVPLPRVRYTRPAQFVSFQRDLLETLGALPGLEAACTSTDLPLGEGDGLARAFQIEGRPITSTSSRESVASMEWVSWNYFQVLGISLLRGDGFTEQQSAAGANVAVISRELARKYFPGENPVGQRLRCFAPAYGAEDQGREHLLEVVGVASDVKHGHPSQKPDARIYIPYAQNPSWQLFLAVRTSVDPAEAGRLMRRAVATVDPRLPIPEIHSMDYLIRNSLSDERVQVVLWTLFAALATALAGIGIYGVLSFAVASGSRDIAVQLALGARRGQVIRAVIAGGLRLAFLGIVAGLALSWIAWRVVSSQLYVSAPLEPMAALEVAFFVALVTISACLLPACRAANINLSRALQCE
jgi:putative ABC transport system permease protein